MGVRLFIKSLADTLAEFQQTPLDDRDPGWVLRNLKERLEGETVRQDLDERDKVSLVMMFQRLDWYCVMLDLQVEYQDDN